MAKKKRVRGGVEIMVEEKGATPETPAAVDESGYTSVNELFSWLTTTYPENQPVDRKSGRVWHLDGKKVVKDPCLENKGGAFFGAHLNDALVDATKDLGYTERLPLQGHIRNNFKLVSNRIHLSLLEAVKGAIRKVHVPKSDKVEQQGRTM